jgi:hypothetical protein
MHKNRDRHKFSKLEFFVGKPPQIRFRIEICTIKNHILKKKPHQKRFFPSKVMLKGRYDLYMNFVGKMSKKRPDFFQVNKMTKNRLGFI